MPHVAVRQLFVLSSLLLLLDVAALAQDTPEPESPWLLTPTISSDPKLGNKFGGLVGYTYQFDPKSTSSFFGGFANYSDTDSYTGGVFADTYFGEDHHKILFGIVDGRIRNDYEDFLGTGTRVKTEDDLHGTFLRYSYLVASHWYVGGQFVSSNYAIGAESIGEGLLDLVGLTGFDSNGLGLVAEFDNRDNVRNPTKGRHFVVSNLAYREDLGGDESFDSYLAQYVQITPFGNGHVLATQVKGRWTHDAPTGGYSSITLRGYTRGNYLAEHYSHIDFDARFHINGRWGASAFAGIGCLYSSFSDCSDSDDLYASAGAGIIYVLKPEAGFVLRAEYAVAEKDNSAFLLNLGHPF